MASKAAEKQPDLNEMINEWVGRLCIAIGKGNFRDEVSFMLQYGMNIGYDQGQRHPKK